MLGVGYPASCWIATQGSCTLGAENFSGISTTSRISIELPQNRVENIGSSVGFICIQCHCDSQRHNARCRFSKVVSTGTPKFNYATYLAFLPRRDASRRSVRATHVVPRLLLVSLSLRSRRRDD